LLKIITEDHGVAPKVVASSDDIDQIAAKGNAADVPALKGWRRELFGEKALQMIEGKIGIKFENRKIKAVPLV
ncbi:ribonuclease D, partial [Ochrobactrum sp. SFR4]|nr:ribonuclease D [Ochrobactrum sp. SFR4]